MDFENCLDDFSMNIHFDCDCNDVKKECKKFAEYSEKQHDPSIRAIQDQIFNCKSVAVYNSWKKKFDKFILDEKLSENIESVLKYLQSISNQYAPSTLWQAYSCLNKYYTTYKNWKSFNEVPILKNFIKSLEKNHEPKKQSKVLSKEELFKFLIHNNNEDPKILVRKVASIVAYYGGLRCVELLNLSFADIEMKPAEIIVRIEKSKTDPKGKSNFFYIIPKKPDSASDECCPYSIIKKYVDQFTSKEGRFLRNYNVKSKNFTMQPMGRNLLAKIPSFIADFLGLQNPEKYTSHCFRRSAATVMADSGATLPSLKRQFRWKSDSVAMTYIDQSKKHKFDVAQTLTIHKTVSSNDQSKILDKTETSKHVHIENCSNIVINL